MADTEKKFNTLDHGATKFVNPKTTSVLDGAFLTYSMTATFNPLRALNPGETSAAVIARVLATLIHDINALKS
jgi:hypothetical protein